MEDLRTESLKLGLEEGRKEGRIEGRKEGHMEGRRTEVFTSVSDGDYTAARGAEKLGLSVETLVAQMQAAGYRVPEQVL